MCALALAKGTPREKAMELFQYFDKDCNGNLDRQEIENMFIEYARFVAVILPIIGAGDPRDDLLHPETIQWYQRGMARNMNHVIVALVHKVLRHPGQERIDHDSFVELMCEDENAKILSSSGLRQFVLKEGGFKRRESKNIYYKELDRKMERVLAITGQAFDMPDCAPPRKKGKRAQPDQSEEREVKHKRSQTSRQVVIKTTDSDEEDPNPRALKKGKSFGAERGFVRHKTIVKANNKQRKHEPSDSLNTSKVDK